MSTEVISLIGVLLGLALVVVGALKGWSLIIIGSVAALIAAALSGMGIQEMYGVYISGVGATVTSLFPIFLGGQLIAVFLENSGLTESIAINIVKRLGTKFIVPAVFIVSWILVFAGVNVFVIIFTVYPLACAFFKFANLPRALIPGIVLGACVSVQSLPGTNQSNNVIPTEAFGVAPTAGFAIGMTTAVFLFVANLLYLLWATKRYQKKGIGFVELEGENFEIDLDKKGLPNPLLVIIPLVVILGLMNGFGVDAALSMYVGAAVCALMFWKRYGGAGKIMDILTKAAKGSISVMNTAALVGFGTLVAAVPAYTLLSNFLDTVSGGNPYIFTFIAVAIIAACCGSASGGMQFICSTFYDKLIVQMGGIPAGVSRVVTSAALTFDSLPHNSAVVLTLDACHVTHKEGYIHVFVCTVLNTTIATIIAVVMATLGIC